MKVSDMEKFGLAALITAWVVWGSNTMGNLLVRVEKPREGQVVAVAKEGASPAKTGAPAPKEESAVALLAQASPADGAKVFKQCVSCHSAEKGAKAKVGPNLWGVVGRNPGQAEGFKYSDAIAKLGKPWTFENLDAFLSSPKAFAPGTKMTFAGLRKAADRAAVMAYLRSLSDSPKPLP